MVGAGFSLNAQPLPGVSSSFSTWNDLARAMFEELHPVDNTDENFDISARERKLLSSDALRLASQYEAAFNRGKLEQLLKLNNPDLLHKPARLHEIMMQLPWRDVFTTNYDTLLERTIISSKAYSCVTTAKDLTQANSPRIIKLHGSFPSTTPFIITEDDYRKYPRNYAPFVNTVQQSLIENSLVLIGFSGEDPNFLAWTGWIRDELNHHHAPIYLVGILNIGNADRQLLKKRGVTPIDLGPIFQKCADHEKHYIALQWFFESLQAAKPKTSENWLNENQNKNETNSIHQLCTKATDKKTPLAPTQNSFGMLADPDLIKLMDKWAYERFDYPGWVVCPKSKRQRLWQNTKDWITPLLKSLESKNNIDKLLALRELSWRMDTIMAPLYTEITSVLRETLDEYITSMHEISDYDSTFKDAEYIEISTLSIKSSWLELAYCDLQEARETYNSSRWVKSEKQISLFLGGNTGIPDRFLYEKILWSVWNSDISAANKQLDSWSETNISAYYKIIKAGLIGELDNETRSIQLLRTTLSEIRETLNTLGHNIELLSLEGWCSYILSQLELSNDSISYFNFLDQYRDRWNELERYQCNPHSVISDLNSKLKQTPPKKLKHTTTVQSFEPGYSSTTRNFSGDTFTPLLPAYAYIRIFEKAGLPMRLPKLLVAGDSLVRACEWIAPTIGYWSPAIVIRSGNLKYLENMKLMSRIGIAKLGDNVAHQLYQFSMSSCKREFSSLGDNLVSSSSREAILLCLIETQSRLAFRVNEQNIKDGFDLALEFYTSQLIKENSDVSEATRTWLKRILYAASDKLRLTWTNRIIELPVPDQRSTINGEIFDPIELIEKLDSDTTDNAAALCPNMSDNINKLIEIASNRLANNRAVVFDRLTKLNWLNLLSTKQTTEFASLLWHGYENIGFPYEESKYYYASYLNSPTPEGVETVTRVKQKLLQMEMGCIATPAGGNALSISSGYQPSLYLKEIIKASKPTIPIDNRNDVRIDWTVSESQNIFSKTVSWWENDKVLLRDDRASDFFGTQDTVHRILSMFDEVLAHVVVPRIASSNEHEWEKLHLLISEIETHGYSLAKCLPSILINNPEMFSTVEESITSSLNGNRQSIAAAASAACHWCAIAHHKMVEPPSDNILSALVDNVSFRRPKSTVICIRELTSIIARYPDFLNETMFDQLTKSLVDWNSLLYRKTNNYKPQFEYHNDDIPGLRQSVGKLAGALSRWHNCKNSDSFEPDGILIWRNNCASETLPEVKRAFIKWGSQSIS